MKKIFLLSLFLLAALVSCKESGTASRTNSSQFDYTGYEISDVPGTAFQKAVKKDAATNRVLEEGYLLNGLRSGIWITYHPQGLGGRRIQNMTHYIEDKVDGIMLTANQQNRIDEQLYYTQNKLDGPVLKYNLGRLQEESNYKDGQLHGPYRKYLGVEKLVEASEYKDGKLHGKYRSYSEDGTLLMEYEYLNGKKVGGGLVEN